MKGQLKCSLVVLNGWDFPLYGKFNDCLKDEEKVILEKDFLHGFKSIVLNHIHLATIPLVA